LARAISSAGERFVHTEEVTGSIPVSPTSISAGQTPVTGVLVTGVLHLAHYCGSKLGAQDRLHRPLGMVRRLMSVPDRVMHGTAGGPVGWSGRSRGILAGRAGAGGVAR